MIVAGTSVRIEAGLWGTAPVFLVAGAADGAAAAQLDGDWDADRLMPGLKRASLDHGRAALWIAEYDLPYARQTLFAGLTLLTERGVAQWAPVPQGGHRLEIAYPEPWPRPVAGTLREGADPIAAWKRILRTSMRRWTRQAGDTLGVELSGGLDSALVAAMAARDADRPLPSYGLAVTGGADAVADQRARRVDLVASLGLSDIEIPMADFLPLGPGSKRVDGTASALPWDEG
ncbi:MAG: asparagine synthase-related protein, partial [Sphingomonas sp.]